jgi:hypothetical protein
MKIKIGNFPNYISFRDYSDSYHMFFNKKLRNQIFVNDDDFDKSLAKLKKNPIHRVVLNFLDTINAFLSNCVEPILNKFVQEDQKVSITIDAEDFANMSKDLLIITYAGLLKIKTDKNGSPMVSRQDVPAWLGDDCVNRPANSFNDPLIHLRWEWTINEILWGFKKKLDEGSLSEQEEKRMLNCFRLFAKYYASLWT